MQWSSEEKLRREVRLRSNAAAGPGCYDVLFRGEIIGGAGYGEDGVFGGTVLGTLIIADSGRRTVFLDMVAGLLEAERLAR